MSSIPQVSQAMETILTRRAKALERQTGFVQRSSAQLDGAIFAQTCVLTWMHTPDASYSQLRHTAGSLGVHLSHQAIEQRFGEASSWLMQTLLEEAVAQVIGSCATATELLARFNGVYLQDGTVISLPASLAQQWRGSGKPGEEAALRVQARVELASGCLAGLWLQEARAAERSGPAIDTPLPKGSLFNADMGYFTLKEMRARSKLGQYWLTQAKATLTILDQRGQDWDLLSFLEAQKKDEVDVQVVVGKQERLAARLIAVRVSSQQAVRRRARANKQVTLPPPKAVRPGCQASANGKRAAPGQSQAQKSECGSPASGGVDDLAHPRAQ